MTTQLLPATLNYSSATLPRHPFCYIERSEAQSKYLSIVGYSRVRFACWVLLGTAYGLGGLCGVYGLRGLSAFRGLYEKNSHLTHITHSTQNHPFYPLYPNKKQHEYQKGEIVGLYLVKLDLDHI